VFKFQKKKKNNNIIILANNYINICENLDVKNKYLLRTYKSIITRKSVLFYTNNITLMYFCYSKIIFFRMWEDIVYSCISICLTFEYLLLYFQFLI
jgi:hypothetical protein